ncbi:acyl transferase [Sinomicrobium weinanense]|uniref:Acyl transferase n=1 Tax=Sinomicrobium weinanense TaxID=2842200 RepID=A0A926JV27_9FLAO|nr:acyl transferase [Sinomicrobium weinanense]MBC9797899.1 acyl transferase [Sinomicrobium weinanense]MBU3125436.1 acyl transferase [Sinomicrobium weinanense]
MNNDVIFNIANTADFNAVTLDVFRHQYRNNEVYGKFCDLLKRTPETVKTVEKIPFLPISCFKTHTVVASPGDPEEVFTSSGTTGMKASKHYVTDRSLYEKSFLGAFKRFYGDIEDYVVLALLPSYLERQGSSLIYMVDDLIKRSGNTESGFYLHNISELSDKLEKLDSSGKKVLLIGVSFALLDLVESHTFRLKNTIIMETGGMKGRRKELIRQELHKILCAGFGVSHIHSEYGMTELLSQAYSAGDGRFKCPSWMKIVIRDTEDALSLQTAGKTGGINVIDLANINSCSFIATQDLGKTYPDGSFEVLGRFDNSDIRGCNLMVM